MNDTTGIKWGIYEGYIADLEELKLLYQDVVDKKYVQTKTEKMKEDDWILVHRPTKKKKIRAIF